MRTLEDKKVEIKNKENINRNIDNEIIEIKTKNGFKAQILSYGATLIGVFPLDKNSDRSNVIIRYPEAEEYLINFAYLGSTVGRWAGRIKNAEFTMDDKLIRLDNSLHTHGLHGGEYGLSHAKWSISYKSDEKLILEYFDPYMEGKTPGDVSFLASFEVSEINGEEILEIAYKARGSERTFINLTNHAYFNLGNHSRTIHDHELIINADMLAYVSDEGIPLMPLIPVDNSTFDFRTMRKVKYALSSNEEQIIKCKGLDHPFKLNRGVDAVILYEPFSGRRMSIDTNQPFCVVYSGNYNDSELLLNGERLLRHGGICFEMQQIPNFPNIEGQSGKWLEVDDVYFHSTKYSFSRESVGK